MSGRDLKKRMKPPSSSSWGHKLDVDYGIEREITFNSGRDDMM